MEKKEIREKILEMRRSLTSKDIEDAAESVFEQMRAMQRVQDARSVLLYSNFDNEVKTARLTGWLLYRGKQVALPTVAGTEMHAVNIRSSELELSRFGVAQPKLQGAQIVPPEDIDLVIVPGVAFDRKKNRIGFGFGYYDRFLKLAKNAYRLAVAYDFQIIEQVPCTADDEKMNMIVTPEYMIG